MIRTLFKIDLLFFVLFISCSSTPVPKESFVAIPDDFFGIVHAKGIQTPEGHALLNQMGITWILETFQWMFIENEKGQFDFTIYDKLVDESISHGRKIIAVLGFETPWLNPMDKTKTYISKENIPYYLNYIEKTVLHFQGRVSVWQIWNEPNLPRFWEGKSSEFFELARLTAQRIKEIDSKAYIIGSGFSRTPGMYIKRMHKAGAFDNMNGISFHPYAVNPRGSMKLFEKFTNVLSKINFDGSVWITEVGYPTGGWYPTRVSLEKFPSYVVKTLTGAATRGADVLLWYQLFDRNTREEVPAKGKLNSERFFGLVYPDLQRKNAAWAYELCARYLSGSCYIQEYPIRENIPSHIVSFCFINGKAGYNTLIIWNDKSKQQKINLNLSSPSFLHNINTGEVHNLQNEVTLDLGSQPLLITWKGNDIPRLYIPQKI